MMRRIMLVVAYDGTDYKGWQIQSNGVTIEEILNTELSKLLNEQITVIGASRTDSGVHAEGAVCVFDTSSRIPGDKFCFAINQSLPEDIRILSSKEVASDFHPRRCPALKTYRYSIWNDTFELPTKRLYTYWLHEKLDRERMKRAAVFLIGEHDFKSFCSVNTQALTTVRTVTDIEIRTEGKQIDIYVTGNGFLYNMVRIIAGTLIEAGRGKIKPEAMKDILEALDRAAAGPTAPAKGLCLVGYKWLDS